MRRREEVTSLRFLHLLLRLKLFSDMTCSKILGIGSGVYPQFAFHTCTTQQEVLCTDAFTTATSPQNFSLVHLHSHMHFLWRKYRGSAEFSECLKAA